jgi:hypothetical protein
VRIGSAGIIGHLRTDELQLLDLVAGENPVAAVIACRDDLLVPVLPGAERRHGISSIRATALMPYTGRPWFTTPT